MSRRSDADLAYQAVAAKIHWLENRKGWHESKAMLANLRRGLGKSPAQMPEIWGFILEDLNPGSTRQKGISAAENAVYQALTLYALGCQGQDAKTQKIQQDGVNVGQAVGRLVKKDPKRLKNLQLRMKGLMQSRTPAAIGIKLRALIPMICEEGGLDFPMLARDLVRLEYPESRNQVGIAWARAFVAETGPMNESDETGKGEENEKK